MSIRQFNPPPFPARPSSSRFEKYVTEHSTRSAWELDALPPQVLDRLIRTNVANLWDQGIYNNWQALVRANRMLLQERMKGPGWVKKSFE